MLYIVERLRDTHALLEDDARALHAVWPGALPPRVREGDCLRFDGARYVLDSDETRRRAARVREKAQALFVEE